MFLQQPRTLLRKKSAGGLSKTASDSLDSDLRQEFVGLNARVPVLNGESVPYINFDNAASTPVMRQVLQSINDFMPWYSSVHRGTGFKSRLSTEAYEEARRIVGEFFGASAKEHVVIFGKNSTEAINKLSYRLPLSKNDIVLVSLLEHHSNDLPWRSKAQIKRIKTDSLGQLDEEHFDELIAKYKGRVKLVAITGASNVTGCMPNIHRLAAKSHAAGAQILVDCAQLAPHREISMGRLDEPGHLDYIAVSAHKMYAPFGSGALIGRRDTFETGEPELRGGGTITVVTTEEVEWACPPDREEAGSPNVVGAVAMAAAIKALKDIGMQAVARHESQLTTYALEKFSRTADMKIYGLADAATSGSRLGVIPFNLASLPDGLVAAVLGTEWGIGVRNGCFCAHPYVTQLLGLNQKEVKRFRRDVLNDDKSSMPGLVRVSFGLYNTKQEIDRLVEALQAISAGNYAGHYKQDKTTGDFVAEGWEPDLKPYFSLS